MKRVFAWVCIVVLSVGAVFFGGCAPKQPVPEGGGYALKIGYTLYPPMDYMEDGQLVGFDADFARAVCEELGYVAQFVEIEWNTKATSLLSGEIDVIWNGMTITEELQRQFLITDAYMENQQVLVVKKEKASKFADADDLAKASSIVVEKGSAGDSVVSDNQSLADVTINRATTQRDAFLEVLAGTSEVAVVDVTMAKTMTAEGTDYSTLTYVDVGFEKEFYGIAMRTTDSVLCEKINALIAKYEENGFFAQLYEQYMA